MADTGWLNPSATGETYNEWTNPTYAYASDGQYASSSSDAGRDQQDYYNFGASIPAGSTINGIEVSVEGLPYVTKNPNFSVKLSWNAGSSWTATKDTGSYSSEVYKSVGGSADTWGRTWAVSEFSNANFRLYIENIGDTAVAAYPCCDHIRIKVYYTEGSTSSSSISVTKSSASSQSDSISVTKSSASVSVSISVTKSSESSQSDSISVTKSSTSVSVSQASKTSSSISISQTKSSASSSSVSISVTKSSESSASVSVTKTSSSISISQTVSSSSVSISGTVSSVSSNSITVSATKSSSSLSVSWTVSSSSASISTTKSSSSCVSISVTTSSDSSTSISVSKSSSFSRLSDYPVGTIIFKLVWGTQTVSFTDQEVNRVEIKTVKRLDLQRLQNRQPVVYELGTSWKTIFVTFDAYISKLTWEKLEYLRSVTSIMTLTMYYSDGVTTAETYSVRIDPIVRTFFYGGKLSAMTPLEIVLYEAAVG